MSKTLFKDTDNLIKGLACGCDGDPRLVTISDEDFAALGELFDRRGAPRYEWNSGTSECDLVPVAERIVPLEMRYQAWRAWADLQSAKDADTNLSGELLTHVDSELSRLELTYTELAREGNSSDEP